MQDKKCLGTLGTILALVLATLALRGGAAAASAYKILYVFKSASTPTGSLLFDKAGNLYGTTVDGGLDGGGTVFKLARKSDGSWTESVLHNFTGGADGGHPLAGVIFDTAGNLYCTTVYGGSTNGCGEGSSCGIVFKLTPNPDGTWTESVLHSFSGGSGDGFNPYGGLIFDAIGNLYGTTYDGGSTGCAGFGCGTVFKLTPNPDGTWTESVLHSFTDADGSLPFAGLIFDGAGSLYGTTDSGGLDGGGTVFKLARNSDGSWTESVLHNFTGGADGNLPSAVGLTFDASGNLYGTTQFGGGKAICGGTSGGCGTVFELKPNPDGTWTESVLHSFRGGADGGRPVVGLILDSAGNLYGTTYEDGSSTGCAGNGCGTVFKLTHCSSGWSERVLHSFAGYGRNPSAPVIFDRAGNLYGTSGGSTNNGLVFEITP